MKKLIFIFALLSIATIAMSQVKVTNSGYVGIGTNSPACKLQVFNGGYSIYLKPNNPTPEIGGNYPILNFWQGGGINWIELHCKKTKRMSDSTYKENIIPLENATVILKQLKTYSYYFKSDSGETRQKDYGILAQELELILPDLVTTSKGDKLVNYDGFFAFLIKGFNEQQILIEQQQNEINILQKVVATQEVDIINLKKLQGELDALQVFVYECCGKPKGDSFIPNGFETSPPLQEKAVLYQNAPNPFSSNTEITCYLPENTRNAVIYIYNLQGVELNSYPLTQTGLNAIIVNGSMLPAGMYLYTLVVNNAIVDTKRMILTK